MGSGEGFWAAENKSLAQLYRVGQQTTARWSGHSLLGTWASTGWQEPGEGQEHCMRSLPSCCTRHSPQKWDQWCLGKLPFLSLIPASNPSMNGRKVSVIFFNPSLSPGSVFQKQWSLVFYWCVTIYHKCSGLKAIHL